MKVAFLGLGIMGSRMSERLLRAGYDVTVWNRTAGKAEALKKIRSQRSRVSERGGSRCGSCDHHARRSRFG